MDPVENQRLTETCRLPRERGDGPGWESIWSASRSPPPRARGWTVIRQLPNHLGPASPASAGMDPSGGSPAGFLRCLPRERGDGPSRRGTARPSAAPPPRARGWTSCTEDGGDRRIASPASAGMDLMSRRLRPATVGLPRERGDGPPAGFGIIAAPSPPPRARGWTPILAQGPGLDEASPASAGMDPSQGRSLIGRPGLPRERGDGPSMTSAFTTV